MKSKRRFFNSEQRVKGLRFLHRIFRMRQRDSYKRRKGLWTFRSLHSYEPTCETPHKPITKLQKFVIICILVLKNHTASPLRSTPERIHINDSPPFLPCNYLSKQRTDTKHKQLQTNHLHKTSTLTMSKFLQGKNKSGLKQAVVTVNVLIHNNYPLSLYIRLPTGGIYKYKE